VSELKEIRQQMKA